MFPEEEEEEENERDREQENHKLRNAAIRYAFPKGCKGIDVEIDNSSRLRSLSAAKNFEISPKLPVNLPNRTDYGDKYTYYKPSDLYPGPSHIYAQSNIDSNIYLPPPQNTYIPPENPHAISVEIPSNIISTFDSTNEKASCCTPCSNDPGKLVIPIPLKNRNSNDCCARTAQLIIPLKNIGITFGTQLRKSLAQKEFDADQFIRNILDNLR